MNDEFVIASDVKGDRWEVLLYNLKLRRKMYQEKLDELDNEIEWCKNQMKG